MGSLTNAQLRKLFLQSVGDSEAAQEEWAIHLTEGQKKVAGRVDVPESMKLDESLVIPANNDRVSTSTLDFSLYSIGSISNSTDGIPCYPEPNGMDGRRLYLIQGGLPPMGPVTHWVRDGAFLFVRQMPTVDTTLRVHLRAQPPAITEGNLNSVSPYPQQYDMAIVHGSALSYLAIHPPPNEAPSDAFNNWNARMQTAQSAFDLAVAEPASPRVEEDRTIHSHWRLRGFTVGPRSMRR